MSELERLLENEEIVSDNILMNPSEIAMHFLLENDLIKEKLYSVVERKGILTLNKKHKINTYTKDPAHTLLKDIISRQTRLTDEMFITDIMYSVFKINEEANGNMPLYREWKIKIKGNVYEAVELFKDIYQKEGMEIFEDIKTRIVEHNFFKGAYKFLNYANNKFIDEVGTERQGGNATFTHSYRTSKYLLQRGFGKLEVYLGFFHDLKEDLKSTPQKIIKLNQDLIDGREKDSVYNLSSIQEIKEQKNIMKMLLSKVDGELEELIKEDEKLSYLPKLIDAITNTIEDDALKTTYPTSENKKIDKFKIYLNEKLFKTAQEFYDCNLGEIGLGLIATKIADSYDNTTYIAELNKEKKDIRLQKNIELIKRTSEFIKDNEIQDRRIYHVLHDLILRTEGAYADMKKTYRELQTVKGYDEPKAAQRIVTSLDTRELAKLKKETNNYFKR